MHTQFIAEQSRSDQIIGFDLLIIVNRSPTNERFEGLWFARAPDLLVGDCITFKQGTDCQSEHLIAALIKECRIKALQALGTIPQHWTVELSEAWKPVHAAKDQTDWLAHLVCIGAEDARRLYGRVGSPALQSLLLQVQELRTRQSE